MPNPSDKPIVTVLSSAGESPWPGLESLRDRAELRHVTSQQDLASAVSDADVLVVTDFRTALVEKIWPEARNLKWVHATSAGVDRLLFPGLIESEVTLTNARGVFDDTIAEYVLTLVLAYTKDLLETLRLQRERKWRHRDTERAAGKKALVVGVGGIGRRIAQLLNAVGFEVVGVGRRAREEDPDFLRVYSSGELHNALRDADFVIAAVPLTDETQGMFDAETFRCMKPTARFINIARGAVVQTDALVTALKHDQIAGAALDVFEEEPLPASHPLWDMPQVVVSPHMSGDFVGWREALSEQFIENFDRWIRGEPLNNLVDKRRGYAPATGGG